MLARATGMVKSSCTDMENFVWGDIYGQSCGHGGGIKSVLLFWS